MTETNGMGSIYPKLLKEVEVKLPMKCEAPDLIKDTMKLFIENKKSLTERLKEGYIEMGEINIELAEYGIEQDLRDLIIYEASLTGRGL